MCAAATGCISHNQEGSSLAWHWHRNWPHWARRTRGPHPAVRGPGHCRRATPPWYSSLPCQLVPATPQSGRTCLPVSPDSIISQGCQPGISRAENGIRIRDPRLGKVLVSDNRARHGFRGAPRAPWPRQRRSAGRQDMDRAVGDGSPSVHQPSCGESAETMPVWDRGDGHKCRGHCRFGGRFEQYVVVQ